MAWWPTSEALPHGFRSKVARSTLADANASRDWRIYADFAQVLIAIARPLYARDPIDVDLDQSLYALDSTTIDLCLSLFPWAKFRQHKAAVKMHTLLDLHGNIPTFIHITDGKVHDVNILDEFFPEAGAFYVMDRGYIDFKRLFVFTLCSAFFVVRTKENVLLQRRYSHPYADISGHGLPAGQLMGMLKTAMRLAVQFRQMPVAALESVDHVLPDLKEREMYATLALLRFDGSREAEYALAGHLPILHYRHGSRDTARLSMEQLPLGLIPGGSYASKRVIYSPRDLFLMVTDGITEVANARDEEFGLTRLQELLTRHAARALPEIWDLIMQEVRQYGLPQDDQSLLLLRVVDPAPPLAT